MCPGDASAAELWATVDRCLTDLLLDPPPRDPALPPHEVTPPQGALLELPGRPPAPARSSRSARSADTARAGSRGRSRRAAGSSRSRSTPRTPGPRLRATAIQTVGGKGYDGFAVAVVDLG